MNFLVFVIVLCISAVVGAICWPYTLNTWLVFLGKPAAVLWWHGILLGFVPAIGQSSLVLAVLTWLIMLFIS